MIDPRIADLFKEIERIKKAILVLAGNLDGVAWRVSSEEERKAGIEIYGKIQEIIKYKEGSG